MGVVSELRRLIPGFTTDGSADAEAPVEADVGDDRERVRRLLESNGGRLWQSDLVDRTEWSPAKVSTTLGGMERAGSVRRYRIGRRKIVCLPGSEPEHLE